MEELNTSDKNVTLEQSLALNQITLSLLESKKRSDLWIKIILLVSILSNIIIAGMFLAYESQFTTTTTETVVTQDTGEGEGNNVYQAGEYAQYQQGTGEG